MVMGERQNSTIHRLNLKAEGLFSLGAVVPVLGLLILVLAYFSRDSVYGLSVLLILGAAFLCFHLHICMALTFDGFMRFSRYGISHSHPILDKLLSILFIVFCFAGFSPFVLFHQAFSLYMSPESAEKSKPFYRRDYMVSLVQGGAILLFLIFFFEVIYAE